MEAAHRLKIIGLNNFDAINDETEFTNNVEEEMIEEVHKLVGDNTSLPDTGLHDDSFSLFMEATERLRISNNPKIEDDIEKDTTIPFLLNTASTDYSLSTLDEANLFAPTPPSIKVKLSPIKPIKPPMKLNTSPIKCKTSSIMTPKMLPELISTTTELCDFEKN